MLNAGFFEVESALKSLEQKYKGPLVVRVTEDTAFMIVEDKYVTSLWFLGKGELSSAELKTLAMVAYYAPVKQSEVIRTRGNRAYEHLKKLEEEGLIRSERYSNTRMLKLSKKFFEYFGDKIVERIRNSQAIEIDRP